MNIASVKEIVSQLDGFLKDVAKFEEKGNKAAGKRVRKFLLAFSKLSKAGRKEISATIAKMPKKR